MQMIVVLLAQVTLPRRLFIFSHVTCCLDIIILSFKPEIDKNKCQAAMDQQSLAREAKLEHLVGAVVVAADCSSISSSAVILLKQADPQLL